MKNYMEQETKSLYREQFEHDNCGIGAVVNSKGIKSHKTVENALKIVETWNTERERMPKGKPEMVSEFCFRSLISFFRRSVKSWGSAWEKKESTGSRSFSSRRKNYSAIRQRRCLRSL